MKFKELLKEVIGDRPFIKHCPDINIVFTEEKVIPILLEVSAYPWPLIFPGLDSELKKIQSSRIVSAIEYFVQILKIKKNTEYQIDIMSINSKHKNKLSGIILSETIKEERTIRTYIEVIDRDKTFI